MAEVTTVGVAARDRYFDTLRAVAIVRVVAYHAFHFSVLALIFPSMGVMFALGGSLMAGSLARSGAQAVRSRIRRLLPALWVMALILVPLMLLDGWVPGPAWPRLLLWVLPLATPPASHGIGDLGAEGAGVLWYLATYLWLVLLSPALMRLYRRAPLVAILLPLLGLVLLHGQPGALGPTVTRVVGNVLTFAPCWLLGFAHRAGHLRRLSPAVVAGLTVGCLAGGLGWAYAHRSGADLNLVATPLANAAYSMGFVLALLRWSPAMARLGRRGPLRGFVSAVNNRAVTIYLWHNVVITLAIITGDRLHLWRLHPSLLVYAAFSGIALGMLGATVLALGWVEDLAARRPMRLSPWPADRTVAVASPPQRAAHRATDHRTSDDRAASSERIGAAAT